MEHKQSGIALVFLNHCALIGLKSCFTYSTNQMQYKHQSPLGRMPRFAPVTSICFDASLVHCIVRSNVCCDWSLELLSGLVSPDAY